MNNPTVATKPTSCSCPGCVGIDPAKRNPGEEHRDPDIIIILGNELSESDYQNRIFDSLLNQYWNFQRGRHDNMGNHLGLYRAMEYALHHHSDSPIDEDFHKQYVELVDTEDAKHRTQS